MAFRRLTKSGFNTQPPEGGWGIIKVGNTLIPSFNTQPPEGGWQKSLELKKKS